MSEASRKPSQRLKFYRFWRCIAENFFVTKSLHVVLKLALGLKAPGEDHTLLQTRKADLIEAADIVWDVGGLFDAESRRFDHHQRGAPVREDGTPFSSAVAGGFGTRTFPA